MKTDSQKILLVDDDNFQLELISGQLADLGWQHVICASSGAQALDEFKEHDSNIVAIISDLSMPDMDGLELMRHLIQCGFKSSIILISGLQDDILSSAGGLAQAHGLHILGYLHKPCDLNELKQLLAHLQAPNSALYNAKETLALNSARLEAAFCNCEFVAWYQPKVNIESGAIIGVEALARWPQANGSFISPGIFVPAMESVGLADVLFFAMARQVASDMAKWRKQGINIKAAINLSMKTTQDLDMPTMLGRIVAAADLKPSDFVIEVTESQLIVNRTVTMESLTRLSLMGFSLSIDDFGTGYSSLMQLIDLPFKELKIDGSFVQRASHEPKAQTAVCLSLLLGMTLKMAVVAEGVETPEQLAFVRASGGTIVQGFYLARPMPFADCTRWLSQAPLCAL